MTSRIMQFSNPRRLWFVGDLHGQYDLLMKAMQKADFSPSLGDQLICTGDLVDCGPKSGDILCLLELPWFWSVLGNHEQMLLSKTQLLTELRYNNITRYLHEQGGIASVRRWQAKELADKDMTRLFELCGEPLAKWIYGGGDWFFSESAPYSHQMRLVERLKQAALPHVLECRLPNHKIGVVHAEAVGKCWPTTFSQASQHEHITLWSREWFKKLCDERMKGAVHHHRSVIDGVDAVVFGHCITPTKKPEHFGNRVYLDVGAKVGQTPYLLRADILLERQARLCNTEKPRLETLK